MGWNRPRYARGTTRALLLSAASLAGLATAANAQTNPPASASDQATPAPPVAPEGSDAHLAEESSAIIVTGSRVARPGLTSPTPVTSLNSDQLLKAAPSTLTESLRTLPALVNTSGPQRNSGTVNGGQSFLDLRALGPTRTLTLLDGQRVVAGAINGSVDVNMIPSALIQRVDIVTGGASAAYGSDAVAGVVNFILDMRFTGFKADAYYGISQQGDNKEGKLSGAYGTSFAGGRGHIVVSGEYFRNSGVRPEDRDWSSRGHYYLNGPAGGPALISAYDVKNIGTFGGMILTGKGGTAAGNAALAGIQFTPAGTPVPYSFGSYRSGTQQIGGDGVDNGLQQDLVRPLHRLSFYGHAEYDLSDAVTVFGEALWGDSESKYVSALNRNQAGNPLTIQRDNAFLPQSIRSQMIANGVTSLTFLRFSRERGFVYSDNDVKTQRYLGGARGKLGSWKWNTYVQHGQSHANADILNVQNTKNMALAIDSVVGPGGTVVCRSTLTNPTNGCVPYNPFGENQPSDAALNYVQGTATSVVRTTETEAEFNVSGPLFEGWAGPISLALGAEYRREGAQVTSDDQSQAGAWLFGNPQPWSGHYDVKEAYAETVVPLLHNVPGARVLELNAAGRVADYSTSGRIPSWKVGLSYIPVDGLRFRATKSRDIRAPNVNDLYSKGRQNTASPTDPFQGGQLVQGLPLIIAGNPALKPEKANTFTVGAVLQPNALPGFSASIDYYDIRIKDAIQSIGPQQLVDQCFAGNQLACAQTVRDANGRLTKIYSVPLNLAQLRTTGIDLDVGYGHSVGTLLGPNTRLNVRSIVAYLKRLTNVVPGSRPINLAGDVGHSTTPHWSGTAQAGLASDIASIFLQARLIGGGKWDVTKTDADLDFNHIKPQAYFDLQLAVKPAMFHRNAEVYLDVRNLLDHDPPFNPGTGNVAYATNPSLYDLTGRTFRLGLRVRM